MTRSSVHACCETAAFARTASPYARTVGAKGGALCLEQLDRAARELALGLLGRALHEEHDGRGANEALDALGKSVERLDCLRARRRRTAGLLQRLDARAQLDGVSALQPVDERLVLRVS